MFLEALDLLWVLYGLGFLGDLGPLCLLSTTYICNLEDQVSQDCLYIGKTETGNYCQ